MRLQADTEARGARGGEGLGSNEPASVTGAGSENFIENVGVLRLTLRICGKRSERGTMLHEN
jgi:hypothetical protein